MPQTHQSSLRVHRNLLGFGQSATVSLDSWSPTRAHQLPFAPKISSTRSFLLFRMTALVAAKPHELHHRRHDQHDGHDRQHEDPYGQHHSGHSATSLLDHPRSFG